MWKVGKSGPADRQSIRLPAVFSFCQSVHEAVMSSEEQTPAYLNEQQYSQLSQWIGGCNDGQVRNLTMLFDSQVNGANLFHNLCDNGGATIVIGKVEPDVVVGGYNPASWNSSGGYSSSQGAFLFVSKPVMTQFSCLQVQHAAMNNGNYGPTFGGGHDLHIQNNGTYSCNGSSYGEFASTLTKLTSQRNIVYRVYAVGTPVESLSGRLKEPFRYPNLSFDRNEELSLLETRRAENFQANFPSELVTGPVSLELLLIGHVGAGKSSLSNLMECCDSQELLNSAVAKKKDRSVTKELSKRFLSDNEEKRIPLRVWDTMGWTDDDEEYERFQKLLGWILEGRVEDGHVMDDPTLENSLGPPCAGVERPSVVGIVAGCDCISDKIYCEQIRTLVDIADVRNVPAVIFLSKVDLPSVAGPDISNLFRSRKLLKIMQSLSAVTTVPLDNIFPVVNYSEARSEMDSAVNVLILKTLEKIFLIAKGRIKDRFRRYKQASSSVSGAYGSSTTAAGDISLPTRWAPIDHSKLETAVLLATNQRSTVYKALWTDRNCFVVVKSLTESPVVAQSRPQIVVDHPHVVKIVGTFKGPCCVSGVVMEFARESLQSLLEKRGKKKQPFSPDEVYLIGGQIASGLRALHQQGVAHAFLKPSNVLMWGEGREVIAKVSDYGHTNFGAKFPPPLPPEADLIVAMRYTDPRAMEAAVNRTSVTDDVMLAFDVFSLGCILLHMATMQPPYSERNSGVLFTDLIKAGRPQVPQEVKTPLREVIHACFKEVEERPSVFEVMEMLSE